MNPLTEKRLLQAAVAIGACVPVGAGLFGIVHGAAMVGNVTAFRDANNHFVYLSGLLLAIGLAFWSIIPNIERHTARTRLLTFIVVIGGLARGFDMLINGVPSLLMQLALGMELVITPLLCWWQGRIAKGK